MFNKIYNKLKLIYIFNKFLIDVLIFKFSNINISNDSFSFHLIFFKTKGLSNKILHQILKSKKIDFLLKKITIFLI